MTKDEYDFYLFIFFYEDKRKDKTPSGISFPRAFPKPEQKWVGFGFTPCCCHTPRVAFGVRHMNMVIGKTYDRPHGWLLMCVYDSSEG